MERIKSLEEADGAPLNNGATAEELDRLKKQAAAVLGKTLPQSYLDILASINGLEYNGHILYGVDEELLTCAPRQPISGLVQNNLDWYESDGQDAYLFLGDADISWYVYEPGSGRFLVLDKPSGSEVEAYDAFEPLLESMLNTALL